MGFAASGIGGTAMSVIPFWKMCGAGNDFVVLDGREDIGIAGADIARRLCARRISVGADGLLIVHAEGDERLRVEYYNADGSRAAFCGNGARCVVRFAFDRRILAVSEQQWFGVRFPGAECEGSVRGGECAVRMEQPVISSDREDLPGRLVIAGVPHLVVQEDDGERRDLQAIRDALFGEEMNITAMRKLGRGLLAVRTLERGSGETLACGSAALAAAACLDSAERTSRCEVHPPSGIPLFVEFDESNHRATLCGEARLVYRGEVRS